MHSVDQTTEAMVRSVLAYAENRLRMDPVPLDKGTRTPAELYGALDGLIRDAARPPDEVLGVYSSVIAPSIISADSPRFLGFIPAAPTKASLLFDMLISCASIQGISWLEASGAIAAENKVLRLIADEAGMPASRRADASSPVGRPATCRPSRWPGRPASSGSATAAAGRRLRVVVGDGRALLDRQHTAAAGDGRAGGRAPRPPADRRQRVRAAHRRTTGRRSDVVAVVCTSGTTNAGIIDDLAGVGAIATGPRLVVPRRRRLRRVRDLRPVAAGRSTTASSRPTRSSWTRTSGCSPRSTAALCSTAIPNWPGRRTPRTRPTSTSSTPRDGEWNPTDYAYHLTRRARGLPLWFSLAVYGVEAYREAIETAAQLARETADLIRRRRTSS